MKFTSPSRTPLRIASYNIRHGMDVRFDTTLLADDITALSLDLVGLQEVDRGTRRTGGLDTLRRLTEETDLPYSAYAPAMDFDGGEYGTALLSRYPIRSFTVTPLPSGQTEPRAVGHAVLDVDGTEIHFFNTHLAHEAPEIRALQFSALAKLLPSDALWFITGDFNTDDFTEFAPIPAALMLNRADHYLPTFPEKRIAIDNILFSQGFTVTDSGMVDTHHSDHALIWCNTYPEVVSP